MARSWEQMLSNPIEGEKLEREGERVSYIIKRDGIEVKRVDSELAVEVYFHRSHSYSMSHALKYEGYTVEKVGE